MAGRRQRRRQCPGNPGVGARVARATAHRRQATASWFRPTTFGRNAVSFTVDASTAGNATISNRNNGFTGFGNTATAGSATIVNNNNGLLDRSLFLSGGTYFFATSNAGNATIVNNSGGIAYFGETSSAANATIINNSGGTTYFFDGEQRGQRHHRRQRGRYRRPLGLNDGRDDRRLEFGRRRPLSHRLEAAHGRFQQPVDHGERLIADGGSSGGIGGSLVKVGSGTLTLAGANTYTGGTTVNAGMINSRGNNFGTGRSR